MGFELARNTPKDTVDTIHPRKEDLAALLQKFEDGRIAMGPEFKETFTDYDKDKYEIECAQARYENGSEEIELGKVAEALVFSILSEGKLNEELGFRAASYFDDYRRGVDMIVEPKHYTDPALATLDVTINQRDIKGWARRGEEFADERPVGLEQKLARTKQYADRISQYDADFASNIVAWIQSGGLHERHTSENAAYFKAAKDIIRVKYYKTPENAPTPNRPGCVIGGPLSVISIDTVFVNRALQGGPRGEHAKGIIRALSLMEFAWGIIKEDQYLSQLSKKLPSRNYIFETHHIKVKTWLKILNQPELKGILSEYSREYQRDPDYNDQLTYYRNTLNQVFGV